MIFLSYLFAYEVSVISSEQDRAQSINQIMTKKQNVCMSGNNINFLN